MKIIYNIEKLERILRDLSVLTGISIAFLDKNRNRICGSVKENDFCEMIQKNESLKEKCIFSDTEILDRCRENGCYESHFCHAGLYDAALPVVINGSIAGYLIMGRVRSVESPESFNASDDKQLKKLYNELPFFSETRLLSLKTLLPSILFADAISLELDGLGEKIVEYIENNLDSDLNVNSICKTFFISKNHLYKYFKISHGTTVNEYITYLRTEKAKEYLAHTSEPIYSVCERVGIDNYTYFCRLFKKKEGLTPMEYRKKFKN